MPHSTRRDDQTGAAVTAGGWTPQDIIALIGAITALIIAVNALYTRASKDRLHRTTQVVNHNADILSQHDKALAAIQEQLTAIDGKPGATGSGGQS